MPTYSFDNTILGYNRESLVNIASSETPRYNVLPRCSAGSMAYNYEYDSGYIIYENGEWIYQPKQKVRYASVNFELQVDKPKYKWED